MVVIPSTRSSVDFLMSAPTPSQGFLDFVRRCRDLGQFWGFIKFRAVDLRRSPQFSLGRISPTCDAKVPYPDDADLPKLWALTSEHLNLAPHQHEEKIFKAILGNCQAVVNQLGAIRNRIGDAHGKGRRPVRPTTDRGITGTDV